jgi:hypothetical protein
VLLERHKWSFQLGTLGKEFPVEPFAHVRICVNEQDVEVGIDRDQPLSKLGAIIAGCDILQKNQ